MNEPFVYETFDAKTVPPERYDELLAGGWRHFGTEFYRYTISVHGTELCRVRPLRIRLRDFQFSKSQRRVLRRNAGLAISLRDARIDTENTELFAKHSARFTENVPESLEYVIAAVPPCRVVEFQVRDGGCLIASSFVGLGFDSASSLYGVHDPTVDRRSIGIFTLLLEVQFAIETALTFHYLGYAYDVQSHYDYKKDFHAMEYLEWGQGWLPERRRSECLRDE
jgi:arginine-tRNA-protein transferase